jgi:hypothetical protein
VRDTGLQTQMQKAAAARDNPPLVATATAVAHIEVRLRGGAGRGCGGPSCRRTTLCPAPRPPPAAPEAARPEPVPTAPGAAAAQVVRALPRLNQLRELLRGCRPYGLEDEAPPGDAEPMALDGTGGGAGSWAGGVGFTTEQLLDLVQVRGRVARVLGCRAVERSVQRRTPQ